MPVTERMLWASLQRSYIGGPPITNGRRVVARRGIGVLLRFVYTSVPATHSSSSTVNRSAAKVSEPVVCRARGSMIGGHRPSTGDFSLYPSYTHTFIRSDITNPNTFGDQAVRAQHSYSCGHTMGCFTPVAHHMHG